MDGFTVENSQSHLDEADFILNKHLTNKKIIFQNASGLRITAVDTETSQKVSIKKLQNPFDNFQTSINLLKEIRIRKILHHDGILPIYQTAFSDLKQSLYIISENMEITLQKIINSLAYLTIDHARFYMYQIIRTLAYLHSANIAHLGLTPLNILLNSNEDLKIYNFLYSKPEEPCLKNFEIPDNTFLRWYQAPEILSFYTDNSHIGTKADIWSAGCILVEMIIRKPLFPGQDSQDQLQRIKDFMVINEFEEESENYKKKDAYGLRLDMILLQIKTHKIRKFQHINMGPTIKKDSYEVLDLIKKMLKFKEEERITARECLEHEFFKDLHDPQDEPLAAEPFDWGFLDLKMDIDIVKEMILNDIE